MDGTLERRYGKKIRAKASTNPVRSVHLITR